MINPKQFKTASLIVKLGNAVTYYRNYKSKEIELTSVQSDAFIATLRNPGLTATQLKEHLQLSQSTVAGIVSRLSDKGLIEKVTDENDARKDYLVPTKDGERLEEPLKKIALNTQQCLVEGMSEEEQQQFDRLLQIALDNINKIRFFNE